MDRFSLTRRGGVLRIDALLLALFAVMAVTGLFSPLEKAFMAVMAEAPISRNYVVVVAILGALLPLTARLLRLGSEAVRAVLDPFLWLLAGQLVSETAVVLLGAKGLAVLVGLVFSLVRLLQIQRLWLPSASIPWLQRLLLLQGVVWGINALQIGVNRIRPLLG